MSASSGYLPVLWAFVSGFLPAWATGKAQDKQKPVSSAPVHSSKFRIAIIGSGPIGKLLACSAAQHPRIQLCQYEAETLPLRPSYGYGVGPQTLHTADVLNPELGQRLREECYIDKVWQRWWHAGDEDRLLSEEYMPEGKVLGRLGRDELMNLLDDSLPERISERDIRYGKRLTAVKKVGPHQLELSFQDGTKDLANAIWAADGVNSLCRKLVQGNVYRPPQYTGFHAYRGKVDARKVAEMVGENFANETYMFIGVKGWHVLIFPIEHNRLTNIAAFAMESDRKAFTRNDKVTWEELQTYFVGCNNKVDTLLKLMYSDTPGGCQRLQVTHMGQLETMVNRDLNITTFGDAANAMAPHLAASMSCGFLGCCTFLHEEYNPRVRSGALRANASDEEIATVLVEAALAYETKHKPLAQHLSDKSAEQGPLWSGGITDAEKLRERALFLWSSADDKKRETRGASKVC